MAEPATEGGRLGFAIIRRASSALRDVIVGASGLDAYGNYVAHLKRHHPERSPLSREAFAAQDLVARWTGVRRCC